MRQRNIRPITPNEVDSQKKASIPHYVIYCFNKLITKRWNGESSVIKQAEIVSELMGMGIERDSIFENNMLDVESVFEEVGWKVEYDKPGYETYDAFFIFTKK